MSIFFIEYFENKFYININGSKFIRFASWW